MPTQVPTRKAPEQPRRAWFVWDALGLACASATWLLMLSAAAVLVRELLLPARGVASGAAHGPLFHLLAALALAAHLRTALTDPGALPVGAAASSLGAEPRDPRCPLCGAVQQARAHHCFVCGRCIRGADHHCPWVNNCVGEDNRKFFVLFALYTALAALHVLLLLAARAVRGYKLGQWGPHRALEPRRPLVFLLLVALLGFLLGSVMFTIQMYDICTGPTRREGGGRGWRSSAWVNLQDVLGHPPSLAWFSPCASPGPPRASGHYDVV